MANMTYLTPGNSGAARTAEILNANMLLLLADRAWLWRHPALMQLPDANGSGSTTIKTSILGLGGVDPMAPVLEGSSTTPTAVSNTSFSVTVARQALERGITDLNDSVDSVGLNIDVMARDMIASAHHRFTDMIAAAGATFQLEINSVEGPYVGLLQPTQWTNLRESLRSEGGAVQWQEATAELLRLRGPGLKGSFIGVDWYASDSVPDDGTDASGCVFGAGAIAYREGSVTRIRGVGELMMATPIYAALDYDNSGAVQNVVGNYQVGVSKSQDLMGVAVITGI